MLLIMVQSEGSILEESAPGPPEHGKCLGKATLIRNAPWREEIKGGERFKKKKKVKVCHISTLSSRKFFCSHFY